MLLAHHWHLPARTPTDVTNKHTTSLARHSRRCAPSAGRTSGSRSTGLGTLRVLTTTPTRAAAAREARPQPQPAGEKQCERTRCGAARSRASTTSWVRARPWRSSTQELTWAAATLQTRPTHLTRTSRGTIRSFTTIPQSATLRRGAQGEKGPRSQAKRPK